MANTARQVDVCILGAGLAGLTLARQLHRRDPDLSITLLEHRRYPVPEAAHKVGESTVEIASHYLSDVLDLKAHLQAAQLPKFGLRLFFRGAAPIHDDLARYDEVGPSRVLPVPTFQLDRGRFENHLAESCRGEGATLLDAATIRDFDSAPGRHRVTFRCDDREQVVQARFLVDASGRRSWLRNRLELGKPTRHDNHAVWFRVTGDIDLEAMSRDPDWLARCHGTPRRLSTNHFTGPGYWVWLIPLASGTTSVGVVFDPAFVALESVSSYDRFMHWLAGEHPAIAGAVEGREVLDFHILRNYAQGSTQTMSADGWMLTGDAGPFSDPFYSPGSDFIAFANGYITELVTTDAPAARYAECQRHFMAFFSNTLSIYRGLYGCMGNRDLMVIKTLWDYTYYWGVLSKLYFTGRYADQAYMTAAQPALLRAAAMNLKLQRLLKSAPGVGQRLGGEGRFFDYHAIPLFHRLKNDLLRGDSCNALDELNAHIETSARVAGCLTSVVEGLHSGTPLPDHDHLGGLSVFQ